MVPRRAGDGAVEPLRQPRRACCAGCTSIACQADYWCVLEGSAFVALYDLRQGSPTQGRPWWHTFDAGEGLRGLYVPPGVAHGFYAMTDVRLQYLVDRAFTGDDEFGFAWNDPDAGIPWPSSDPIVSDRDASNPPLAEALADPPVFAS